MNGSSFRDYFSAGARDYARFRPGYPAGLFEWLAGIAPRRHRAWDCATGSGQAAVALAAHFDEVIATDASAAQLLSAAPHQRVRYLCATAECSGLQSWSVDLVTVAQALHWFDLAGFYREVNRVVAPGGLIAVWSYGATTVDARIDEVVGEFYGGTVGDFWPKERVHVERGYRDLAFPFTPIESPEFAMSARWTLGEMLGYIGTWSAVHRYRAKHGDAAVETFATRLGREWGEPSRVREVRWPLVVKAGRVGTSPH
jgi:ubiquinone/menaquinone biosynthesis C-methylase UbiE